MVPFADRLHRWVEASESARGRSHGSHQLRRSGYGGRGRDGWRSPDLHASAGERWTKRKTNVFLPVVLAMAIFLLASFAEENRCRADAAVVPRGLLGKERGQRGEGRHVVGTPYESERDVAGHRDLGGKIIGGGPADRSQVPYQALLKVENNTSNFYCGGTLVHPQFVVTAAHCVVAEDGVVRPTSAFTIGLGTTVNLQGNSVKVAQVWSHPNFARSFKNDIALLKLASPQEITDTVIPIKVAYNDGALGSSTDLTISGWGSLSETDGVSPNLQAATVNHLPSGCEVYKPPAEQQFLRNFMICGGCLQGGVDTCQGDSGGPATVLSKSKGCPILVGVTSFGEGCAREGFPGVYTRLSAYAGWLEQQAGISFTTQYTLSPSGNCHTCGGPKKRPCGLVPKFDLSRCKIEGYLAYAFTFRLKPCVLTANRTLSPPTSQAPVEATFSPSSLGSFSPRGSVFFLQGRPGGGSMVTVDGVHVRVPMGANITSFRGIEAQPGLWTQSWPSEHANPKGVCSNYYSYAALFLSSDKKYVQVSSVSKY